MDLNSFVYLAIQGKQARVISTQAIDPKGPRRAGGDISNNEMRMLISLPTVKMTVDRGMGIFPNLEEGICRVLIVCQGKIMIIQQTPRAGSVKRWALPLGKENV
jgi:hypothetical protein